MVLTGTQLGTYGFDIPGANLFRLVERVLRETGVPRLRVSSLQPQELTDELLDLWSNPRLCPHFHLPLQSGSREILSRMRRRYTPRQYAQAVEAIERRVPDAAITADVIVGFPGETAGMFQETLRFCQSMGYAGLHVFPYSPRPETSAAHFGEGVEERVKRERMSSMLPWPRSGHGGTGEGCWGAPDRCCGSPATEWERPPCGQASPTTISAWQWRASVLLRTASHRWSWSDRRERWCGDGLRKPGR